MKRIYFLFIASLTLTVLSALAFFNNLVAVGRWWQAFLAAGGDTSGVPAHAPGCFAWLDWTAVDYSAVTTFIPFLGFACLLRSAWRLLRRRPVANADDFPFFRGSDQLNVALGLFGTLWGIIVIGYFELETVTMADLMQCLHTALFSTLMAVVWVFLIDRPLIRPFFQRLLSESKLARVEDGDLAGAVDRLVERLSAASEAFDKRQVEFENAFRKRQAEAEAEAENRQQRREQAFAKRLGESDAAFAKRISETDAAIAKHVTASFGQLALAQEKSNEAVSGALAELERVRRETAEQCARELADYQRSFEMRQKEYVEFFKREIAELERRASSSETKLRAVISALQS